MSTTTITTTVQLDAKSASEAELVAAIRGDWTSVNFGAAPYLDAMEMQVGAGLSMISDDYLLDGAGSIVYYFLANANAWRGDVARTVKAELKRRLKAAHGY